MCVDFAIHDTNSGNPHCHIMLTMRPLDERGAWAAKSKKEYDLDENGERIRLPSGRYKTHKVDLTVWNSQENALVWRKAWADISNDYCADCGARMGFISPEANHSEKHYDSDSAFQCGNYRSKSGECVSHYVKTSVLEAAILQAIQAVSKYVLENEDEFIQQLKAVWNEQQPRTANNSYGRSAERHHE